MNVLARPRQLESPFVAGRPELGYYNDLRPHLATYVPQLGDAFTAVARLTGDRSSANPVTIAQAGLGAWQESRADERWLACVDAVATWLAAQLDEGGALEYRFPLHGTYDAPSPWLSAMAQGEIASLFVRAAAALGRPELREAASLAVRPLLEGRDGLVQDTPEGPVLEEYPTSPPSHVLNGWVFALWGLYDVAHSGEGDADAAELFMRSTSALVARLRLYELGGGWSRYDLYPHPLPNVASPFYHALHAAQLRALATLADEPALAGTAARWDRALGRPLVRAGAVAAKVAFRFVRPRRRRR